MQYQARLQNINPLVGWAVVVISAMLFFFEFGLGVVFNSLAGPISKAYNLDIRYVSIISSLYFYTNIIFLIPAGLLIDRYSAKACMLMALTGCVISVLLIATSQSVFLLVIARLITGAASSFCLISVVRVATNWFPSNKMGLVIGVSIAIGMLGGWFAQAPLTALIEAYGWQMALKIVAGVGICIIVLIGVFVSNTPANLKALRKEQQDTLKSYPVLKTLSLALKKPQNWFASIYVGLINVATWMLGGMWANAYLGHVYGVSASSGAYVTGFMFFGMVCGYPIWGAVTQFLGRRKLPMLAGSILSLVVVLLLMNASNDVAWLSFLFFALGFMTSAQTVAYPYVGEINTMLVTSSATSIVSMMALLWGGVFGMPLFGALMTMYANSHHVAVESAGSYQFAIWIVPVAFALSFIFALLTKETYCVRQVE